MGNNHAASNDKKTVRQDEVVNGNGIIATVKDPLTVPADKVTLASVADLTELQKRLLQESW